MFVYDGTFEGLLTAVYEAFYSREKNISIREERNLQKGILEKYINVITEDSKWNKVYGAIKSKISSDALEHVYRVFLSENENCGDIIYRYLVFGFKAGPKVDSFLADDRVLGVHKISRRVEVERHKFLGFVRFSLVMGNVYYSVIEPDNNITALLAPHFAQRMSDQRWIIHDIKREAAAVYNLEEWFLTHLTVDSVKDYSEDETKYRRLWKEFFNTVSIKNRENSRLQKNLMPRRYWKHLHEKW